MYTATPSLEIAVNGGRIQSGEGNVISQSSEVSPALFVHVPVGASVLASCLEVLLVQ